MMFFPLELPKIFKIQKIYTRYSMNANLGS